MKRTITLLPIVLLAMAVFSGCSKSNTIPTVSGSINGIPALTLYGTSGQATDYIFIVISSNSANRKLSYGGSTYTYNENSQNSDINIVVTTTNVVKATLDTTAPKTVLTIDVFPTLFSSGKYIAR